MLSFQTSSYTTYHPLSADLIWTKIKKKILSPSNQLTKFEAASYKIFRDTCIFIKVFNAQINSKNKITFFLIITR